MQVKVTSLLSSSSFLVENKRNEDDARYTLTDDERQAVIALKAACDAQCIPYKSNFELAKYVLVCHSSVDDKDPQAETKRLELALKRMKKRRAWEAKHNIDDIDPIAALQEINEVAPDLYVHHFLSDRDGNKIVAHNQAHVPCKFISQSKENLAKFLAAESFRYDLAAADMEEARRGIALMTVEEGQLTMRKGLRYLHFIALVMDCIHDMHCTRFRYIYAQVPASLTSIAKAAKAMVPRRLASRVVIFPRMDLFESNYSGADVDQEGSSQHHAPPDVMGWTKARKQKYDETLAKLAVLL